MTNALKKLDKKRKRFPPARSRSKILRLRYDLIRAANNDHEVAGKAYALARDNPVWFINTFGWTYDPRKVAKGLPAFQPFLLYPSQEALVEWVLERWRNDENGAIPKARGVGATWTLAALSIWFWLFKPGASITWGSRKEALVDSRGDPDSVFEMIRIIRRRLPSWLVPIKFDEKWHDNHMRLVNPETDNTVVGEVGRDQGRGGRSSLYFRDEAAYGEGLDEIERAVAGNANCVIDLSTPNGIGQPFERKVHGGHVPIFEMPWWSVPDRDEVWFKKKKREMSHDPIGFAQEVNMDFGGSMENVLIPIEWVRAAVEISLPPADTKSAGLDVGDQGGDRNVLTFRSGSKVLVPQSWSDLDTTQTARKAIWECNQENAAHLFFDSIGVGAGVSGETNNFEGDIGFKVVGVNVGESPTELVWPNKRTSQEMFTNLKAELLWLLRERFRKTWEFVEGLNDFEFDEMIDIPNHPNLRSQCSWPKYFRSEKGKISIEKKKNMKKRLGTNESPDFLESLMLAFAGDAVKSSGWFMVEL